jgi:hypothetical protein
MNESGGVLCASSVESVKQSSSFFGFEIRCEPAPDSPNRRDAYEGDDYHSFASRLRRQRVLTRQQGLCQQVRFDRGRQRHRKLLFGIDWDAKHYWAALRTEAVNALVQHFGIIDWGRLVGATVPSTATPRWTEVQAHHGTAGVVAVDDSGSYTAILT